ncbi:MAG: hypothetical protein LBR36_07260, partial [Bacteroidales bacterium]|nr:hypothetical protein [Bacteroidales bacterium]
MKELILLILVAFLATVSLKSQVTRYVTVTGAGAMTGLSWADASPDLQAMINASAPGDEIWVGSGTYEPIYDASNVFGPPTPGNPDNAFVIHNGVFLRGGYSATGGGPRNWITNQTILTGLLNSGLRAYHILIAVNATGISGIEGFYFQYGTANGGGNISVLGSIIERDCGGAIYIGNATFKMGYTDISDNLAIRKGAGVYSLNSPSILIKESNIWGNFADMGASVYLENSTIADLLHNNIYQNQSFSDGAGYALIGCGHVEIRDTDIHNNRASRNGGGIYNFSSYINMYNSNITNNNAAQSGGGLYNENISNTIIAQSFISDNTAIEGAGMYNFNSTLTIQQSCITNNNAVTNGGGVLNTNTTTTLINVEIDNNTATAGGGIYEDNNSNSALYNVLINDNQSASNGAGMY